MEITATEVEAGTVDMQGIDWLQVPVSRDVFRDQRIKNYRNYKNLSVPHDDILKDIRKVRTDANYYRFRFTNIKTTKCSIIHFQLRNLLWATSKNDVFYTHDSTVRHWCPVTGVSRVALDLGAHDMGAVKISTMAAACGVMMVGDRGGPVQTGCITADPNGITNHVDIERARSGGPVAFISSNDERVRAMDLTTMQVTSAFPFPWPVNCTTLSPDRRMLCVVGDDTDTLLVDAKSGETLRTLSGHIDYSFACAWHPSGRLVATGNQDMTTRVYDTRNMSRTLAVLGSRLGAVRSLRFSDCGRWLCAAEPADFVHLYDVGFAGGGGFATGSGDWTFRSQVIDFFGEIAGVGFTPGDASSLFIGNA
ncbi:hypothetical protein HK104_008880, partial [Borealophlyctis nickersoniae]